MTDFRWLGLPEEALGCAYPYVPSAPPVKTPPRKIRPEEQLTVGDTCCPGDGYLFIGGSLHMQFVDVSGNCAVYRCGGFSYVRKSTSFRSHGSGCEIYVTVDFFVELDASVPSTEFIRRAMAPVIRGLI